jgi:hypothetical protein
MIDAAAPDRPVGAAGQTAAEPRGPEPSLNYLLGRLAIVESRVRAAVERRRADDPDPGDRFRGLYISDAQVDGLLGNAGAPLIPEPWSEAAREALAALDRAADDAEAAGHDIRLRRLARAFSLDGDDVELLLIALAPISTRDSSGCTATCTTTSRAGARAPGWRWSWQGPAPGSRAALTGSGSARMAPSSRTGSCSSRSPTGRS